jgi:hypothetical protein
MTKTIKIVQDSSPESPRTWDNLGTMAYKHRNYTLGEEEINEPIEWLEDKLGLSYQGTYSNERLQELEERFYDKYIALPLYLYDHSGQTIRTTPFSCRWDSGKVGYIYMTKAKALKEYGGKIVTAKLRERVEGYLKGEVETFDQWMRGDVYGFQVLDEDGDIVDSCYGFYGLDFATNGMTDHIDIEGLTTEEVIELLEAAEIEY